MGRPWTKVYSEISEHLRATSAVQQHVRDHLKDLVALHSCMGERGRVFAKPRFGKSKELHAGQLFVDPRSGLLRSYRFNKTVKKARPDPVAKLLKPLFAAKSRLLLEGRDVFKVFLDPGSKRWTVRHAANKTHARRDFLAAVADLGPVEAVLAALPAKLLKHEYFAT